MKTIKQKIPAKPFTSNSDVKQSYRVIGTTDINGKGTVHPLADVDPFIFLDETNMRGDEAWPFPKHPHSGLVAITYMLAGKVKPWDNKRGYAPFNNSALGLYYINAGKGILHEEAPIVEGGPLRWLQLWVNPGIYNDSLPQASAVQVPPEDIPVHSTDAASIRVVIGEAHGKQSPLQPDWPIQYLHVTVQPGAAMSVPLHDASWHGFVYVLDGDGHFGANQESAAARDCLVLGDDLADTLDVVNHSADDVLQFVVLTGKPHNKPFHKILGGGGALIADTDENARAAMRRFEREGEDFGNKC